MLGEVALKSSFAVLILSVEGLDDVPLDETVGLGQCIFGTGNLGHLNESSNMKLLRLTTTRQGSTSASSSAFTRSSLDELRARLDPIPSVEPFRAPAHTVEFAKRPASEAAVLIPLLNIGQQPHVLMELRSSGLRTHAGEIR